MGLFCLFFGRLHDTGECSVCVGVCLKLFVGEDYFLSVS